jgi:hypothetical protein
MILSKQALQYFHAPTCRVCTGTGEVATRWNRLEKEYRYAHRRFYLNPVFLDEESGVKRITSG